MPRPGRKARPNKSKASQKRPGPAPSKGSIRGLAKRLGVSHVAVLKGVRSGRFPRAIGADAKGRPVVLDAELAAKEWAAGATRPPSNGVSPGQPAQGSLSEAQRMLALERHKKLALEVGEKSGALLDADAVRLEYGEAARVIREAMLGVPDRVPGLSRDQRLAVEAEIRAALSSAADTLEDRDAR